MTYDVITHPSTAYGINQYPGRVILPSQLRVYRMRGSVLLLVFNALDLLLTYVAISQGASEGNPMAMFLIESYLAIPIKLGICLFGIWAIDRWKDRGNMVSVCAVWMACGVYALVVVLNSITLTRLLIA